MIKNSNHPPQGPTTSLPAKEDFFHIGSGFRLVGKVTGTGLCVINGNMDGTLDADLIKVNPGASVLGETNCLRLDVAGYMQGKISTDELLLRSTAVIQGAINYKTIVIEKGAEIDGDLQRTEKTSAKHSDDVCQWVLPEEIHGLINNAKEVRLTLSDGSALPEGFELNQSCITVNRLKLAEHIRAGGISSMSLKVDQKVFSLGMPFENGVVA